MTSHMKKKKAKRYQEGGEAEDKKRGLAASNKEGSVGFFERLRMGNIDDPKSEAYKRFGAGRGKAEAAKTTAPTINQVDERLEEGKTASGMPREARGIENKPKKRSTFGAAFAGARADGKKTFEYPKVAVRCLLRKPKKKRQRLNQPLNQPLVNLQQPLPLDPIVVLKTKAMLAKKQLVRPKKLRWQKPVRCVSKQILAMFQQMFVALKRRQLRASAVT
jgi:hypothetical protein